MHGTTPSVRPAGRFSGPAVAPDQLEPAWRPWVRLLDVAIAATSDAEWARAVPEPTVDRSLGAPLLDGTVLRVDARRARRLLRELLREAERSGEIAGASDDEPRARGWRDATDRVAAVKPAARRRLDVLAIFKGAITQDAVAIGRAATAAQVDAGRLGAVAQLAVIPLLVACATRLRDRVPEDWEHGYCPVCGAWPAIAELRGLERNRRLRCGRCSSDWPIPVLRCPFCGELHHDKLHAFLPEGEEQTRRVDVCETCKGYMKGFSTLQPMPLRALATADLATIELDIVAQERGYERPARPAYPMSVTIAREGASAAPASS